MLELRFRTLMPVVEKPFIVVACTRTHQGQPVDRAPVEEAFLAAGEASGAPAILRWVEPSMNLERGGRVHERSPDERGPAGTPWFQHMEKQHRDGVAPIVREYADVDDVIMVSDVDEIPDPVLVRDLLTVPWRHKWLTVAMRFHSTALDLLHPQQPWWGTCVALCRDLAPQAQRDARTTVWLDKPTCAALPDTPVGVPGEGGVHLSWFGTDLERQRKLETFSHAELAGWDPMAARLRNEHANGEKLHQLTLAESYGLWYPKPLLDGTFHIPEGWFSDHAFET